jgi:hypothetical protein
LTDRDSKRPAVDLTVAFDARFGPGALKEMEALAEKCMGDYDEDGWRQPALS